MKHDVVFILRNDYDGEELKYALRSVCLNFPFRKIVFVGGCPKDIKPDIYIPDVQEGATKWARANHSIKLALSRDDLTEDIWIFNDDFFIMDRVTEDVNYFNGTLEKRVIDLKKKNPSGSNYIRYMDVMRNQLVSMNKDTLSFALHVPFLINRVKAMELYEKFPNLKMFRSLYGNYFEIDCKFMKDCKVYDLQTIPDTPYISTTDAAFKEGKVGKFLRKYFNKPSQYEINQLRIDTRERYDEEGEIRYES